VHLAHRSLIDLRIIAHVRIRASLSSPYFISGM
jgi:hypothetical protein